ncbi:MAG: IS3 family transposase [Bacteroidetes bacterium]|nr:IS3 family transposase [Bacteroidota bacterium]
MQRDGNVYNIKRIRRLMYKMGLIAQYPKRNTSRIAPGHKKYPYILRNMSITQNNQVWSMDITYIPLSNGFMYLTAVIDWHSRYILSYKLSNTMTVEFCKSCKQEAIDNYGSPQIFNTDQGSQFTSERFTNIWQENKLENVQISMDGRGRATDNAFIERVWRSVKQEKIYANKFKTGTDLWLALTEYFNFYNHDRSHQSLAYKTPAQVYLNTEQTGQPIVLNILTSINKEKSNKKEILQQQ